MIRNFYCAAVGIALFSCTNSPETLHSKDKYMCQFTVGMNQKEMYDARYNLLKNGHSGAFRLLSDPFEKSDVLYGKLGIYNDSPLVSLELNDDTIRAGNLRRFKLGFLDLKSDVVYRDLCSMYGKPSSHDFHLGNSLLQGPAAKSKEFSYTDTAWHLWKWTTPTMVIEHRYNVFPPEEIEGESYIEYRVTNYEKIRENDRLELVKSTSAQDAVSIQLVMNFPTYKPPPGMKHWKYTSTVGVLCLGIKNNDLSPGREITSIKGDVQFYNPANGATMQFPKITIVPPKPIAFQQEKKYDPPLSVFEVKSIESLRPQYQDAVRDLALGGDKIEQRLIITEIKYSDGTVLKGANNAF